MELFALACGALLGAAVAGWTAYGAGLRAGRARERVATNRFLHDSVLPTFEAFGLATASDESRAATKLAELRRVARAQATVLRRGLASTQRTDQVIGLGHDIDRVLADFAGEGLRVELTAQVDGVLPEPRQAAVREALREALRNTVKHAGVDRTRVRVSERDGGIAVEAWDEGSGFDARDRPPGFGIRESIVARMREVGGTGAVVSEPGVGTRVTLWVPR
ncbi:sensor histidine kinase [Labedaea rhizosphaerae]|uniref:Histidine kinase/DNA gyrase B/HSP90-like ATPase n=1 Tax=Labedaea rhizosphaerae TaxID=598644 RepID=A0A4R6S6U6_LABRH|nr:ATP-binding protein [Labedaea rhizosphaerae]TDP95054.1 histidine kinase/DNA gyrase B/HSP90-like ATPase [Labedaea rhizosphaerae]